MNAKQAAGVLVLLFMHKKIHLPEKTCPVCQRPFSWRKKWEKNWANIVYCSERCRRNKSTATEKS
jgi:hypothetical protein